ncbi:hypothetical protein BCR34DRAFT_602119 [Clohesyomyces aquaticus]|uniref:Zn(2)-C6 fungal-type domain-containing protein n=1 Tax=Clohesyomyces aquaticus TaxID=1231657 RepID=A0A1Y1ZJI2_9PLEO|nr:hypothetical protein BCR34DRAFT_602119 [Clohesyomyces aquaticus]
MDDNKLRQLERQYKLRVKTGCETCRIRRVKCDETKPECQRCTKTGRKCEGYRHLTGARDLSPAARAAKNRDPNFLAIQLKPSPTPIPRDLSRSLSPEAAENRSFFYFRTCTLPKWTEFFESDLWSQKILQLCHTEPAIKHGILALSTMHERFEQTHPIFSAKTDDFAFVQYMRAVKHSNDLLTAHQEGKVDVDKILIACIIFTCYENLAGNYRAANMHLQNGLRILNQHKANLPPHGQSTATQESIANVLYRFDLQAMTFSDNTSPYDYNLDTPPDCPHIPEVYTVNADARNDLVGIIRCMMWISGVANIFQDAVEHPTWLRVYTQAMGSFERWKMTFDRYQQTIPPEEQGDPKIYAGNTLLKIYGIMSQTIVAAGSGLRSEMLWDSLVDSFKTIVDLAETLPILTGTTSQSSSRSSASPPRSTPSHSNPPSTKHRPIAPNPGTSVPSPPPGMSTLMFLPDPKSQTKAPRTSPEFSTTGSKRQPSAFSPSFELSPIVPLFITACRCRDPVIRRRAIALLLNCRRREGVWDSFGAGMVSLQCVKLEEGLDEGVDLSYDNWLPLGKFKSGTDIPEPKRVQDVFVAVNMAERQIAVNYHMRSGLKVDRYVKF